MTGLFLKDFLILRKALYSYLSVAALYVVLAFTGVWSPEFLSGFLPFMMSVMPMNVFAYDKQAKWDVYNLALPVGRTKTVAARYLVSLALSLSTVVMIAVLGAAMAALGRLEDPASYLATCAICTLLGTVLNAILLPLLYKFGPERARFALYGLMALIGLGVWLFLIPMGGADWIDQSLEKPAPAQLAAIPAAAALACLALLALSFLLSRHFYEEKDA